MRSLRTNHLKKLLKTFSPLCRPSEKVTFPQQSHSNERPLKSYNPEDIALIFFFIKRKNIAAAQLVEFPIPYFPFRFIVIELYPYINIYIIVFLPGKQRQRKRSSLFCWIRMHTPSFWHGLYAHKFDGL